MNSLKVCNIFCTEEEDYEILKTYLKDYPVFLSKNEDVLNEPEPCLIIGWNFVKNKYKNQNIFDKKIYNSNYYWCFSKKEEEKEYLEQIKNFINNQIINWLPSDFFVYDPFFDGSLELYVKKHFDLTKNTYLYCYNGALYVFNNGNNYVLNVKTLLYASEKYKEQITKIFNNTNFYCFSYDNIGEIVHIDDINNFSFESIYWVKYGIELDEMKQFNIIPNFYFQKYVPFFMSFMGVPDLDSEDIRFAKRMIVRDKVTYYCSNTKIAVSDDFNMPDKKIDICDGVKFVSINFSNKRTLTNRLVAKDVWNIQNENKNSEKRAKIISRFNGGKILVCDYQSFETWLSIFYTNNTEFTDSFKNKDVHGEVAKILYNKENVSNLERDFAKILNHSMLYGASYEKLISMINEKGILESNEKLYYVQQFLRPIIENSKIINNNFKNVGYSVTDWGTIVKSEKEYAAYNNLIQTTASEIIVDKIQQVKSFLRDKESVFLFQVHDSLVFDFSPNDKEMFYDLLDLISSYKDKVIPVVYSFGDNYFNLSNEKKYLKK